MKGIFVDSLSFNYPNGVEAIKKISLIIHPGEIIAIMGRNGAGKSTFMKLLNGLLTPSSGTVFVDGIVTTSYRSSDLTRKIGVMFQNPEHQLFCMTVEDEIDFSLKNLNLNKKDFQHYKDEIVKKLDLKEFMSKSPFNLSGGERKKISIASILCRRPDYLIFDEPTLGADKKQRRILQQIIENEKKEGKTIIIITHDTDFAFTLVDRILVFENGRILADGPTQDILKCQEILKNSSMVRPQINKLMIKISDLWNKKHKDVQPPVNFMEINDFNDLNEKIANILEV
jgi:energy-coupling factor transport system ATP-binding protein